MIESIFFNPWIWILPYILGLFLLWLIFGVIVGFADDFGNGFSISGIAFGAMGVIGIGIGYFGFLMPPYDTSYYQTYKITGELTEVESAFNADGGTMSQVFVARVDGIDLFIESDDQRFRTLKAGDDVNLVCGKVFNYFQEPYYNCDFSGVK